MNQKSTHSKTETLTSSKSSSERQFGSHNVPSISDAEVAHHPSLRVSDLDQDQGSSEESELKRIKELPKEVGVMLITAGIVGLILPGPGTPAIIAGGLALWPAAFGKLELWLERRYPGVHRQSMKQIGRFLNDLERRYPHVDRD